MEFKKPINLNINKATEEYLRQQAEKHGYIYGGKGSISRLLDAIGSEELIIEKPIVNSEDGYNVNFKLSIRDFPGTLSKVSKLLSTEEITVIGVETVSQPRNDDTSVGYCDIIVNFPKENKIVLESLINEIMNLKVEDICSCAHEDIAEQIKKKCLFADFKKDYSPSNTQDLIGLFDKLNDADVNKRLFDFFHYFCDESIEAKNKREKIQKENQKEINEIMQTKIVLWCRCSAAIEIKAKAEPGLFADITRIIAEEKLGILSTKREAHVGTKATYRFHVNIKDFAIMSDLTTKIKKHLQKKDSEVKVEQINIEEIITRHERI